MGSPLKNFKQAFLVVIHWVYQIYCVVYEPLLDEIIQHCVARQTWRGVNLKDPTLQVLIHNDIESIQVEARGVVLNVVLGSDHRLETNIFNLLPDYLVPIYLEVVNECLFKRRKAHFCPAVNLLLSVDIIVVQVIFIY